MLKKSLEPLVEPDSKILILGTMPGEKSIALQQYYGNKGNYFWKILYAVLEIPFSADYTDRKLLLQKHKIALWNTLQSCERTGSRDDKIINATVNDFELFFQRYPTIRIVFFESMAAARMYKQLAFIDHRMEYKTLPSTSGLNAGTSYTGKLEQWQQLREYL
jgi:hypoxanthine-DNA glycosylase